MIDQASVLRQSIRRERKSAAPDRKAHRPSIVVVAGKGGVGTTTVAIHLAAAWAQREQQVCIIDADIERQDVANLLQLSEAEMALQPRTTWETWHEHTLAAPAGPHVASASSWAHEPSEPARLASRILVSPHPFDAVVVDVGYQDFQRQQAWCLAATHVVMVTTPDTIASMDSYGLLKRLGRMSPRPPLGVIGNQVPHDTAGCQAVQRVCESARRFLGWTPLVFGQIPLDHRLSEADPDGRPRWHTTPCSESARAVDRVAGRVWTAVTTCGQR